MNVDVFPTNDATADAENKHEESSSYDDFLPASYRTSDDDIASPALTTSFLQKELGVKRLNEIHKWLWLVGRPMPPRPLHYQKAVGRNIIVHEQADLHLVWDEQRIFLKPIPRYLLDRNFWREILSCNNGCESPPPHKRSRNVPPRHFQASEKHLREECAVCHLRALATGFLHTYTALLSHESDFHTARSHNLIPSSLAWPQWRAFVKSILSSTNTNNVHPRYHYGELRLSRLNKIYMLTFRAPLRGYLYGYNTYHSFWSANTKRVAAGFAYLVVALTAMQVGLATAKLEKSEGFQKASWGFTVFSIVAPLGMLGLVGGLFVVVFVVNWVRTRRYWKRRMGWIERGRTRAGA